MTAPYLNGVCVGSIGPCAEPSIISTITMTKKAASTIWTRFLTGVLMAATSAYPDHNFLTQDREAA